MIDSNKCRSEEEVEFLDNISKTVMMDDHGTHFIQNVHSAAANMLILEYYSTVDIYNNTSLHVMVPHWLFHQAFS